MAIYTRLSPRLLKQISSSSGVSFDLSSCEAVPSGSTDSCYYLSDVYHKKYFLKIHETSEVSPHGVDVDPCHMVEFADYLSSFNHEFSVLRVLKPHRWRNGKVFGHIDFNDITPNSAPTEPKYENEITDSTQLGISSSVSRKIVSIWPYIKSQHPVPSHRSGNYTNRLIDKFARATAEFHNVSLNYSPSVTQRFPKHITDIEATVEKLLAIQGATTNIKRHLDMYDDRAAVTPTYLLQLLSEKLHTYAAEWRGKNLDSILVKGYLHGELKPSNTLIDENGKIVFIDICKAGLGPLTLEVGMASQTFTNMNELYLIGIQKFARTYTNARNQYPREELQYIPLMIKISAIRLAVYRAFAIAQGLINQKSVVDPLHICLDIDKNEDALLSVLKL